MYYRASNLVRNNVLISKGVFEDNVALPTLAEVHDQPLNFPGAEANRLASPVTEAGEVNGMENDEHLLNPRSIDPCQPGGGGAVCLVLSGTASRAPVDVDILRSNFTRNSAVFGGGLLIAADVAAEWQPSCDGDDDTTQALWNPCRHLNLRELRFERNRASEDGGAMYVEGSSLVLVEGTFDRNRATKGGSLALSQTAADIRSSIFMNGEASSSGGFIAAERLSTLSIESTSLTNGQAAIGGGLFVQNTTIECFNCEFRNHKAETLGGAVFISSSSTQARTHQFVNSTFERNSADYGPASFLLCVR